jgi:hypothetical protein
VGGEIDLLVADRPHERWVDAVDQIPDRARDDRVAAGRPDFPEQPESHRSGDARRCRSPEIGLHGVAEAPVRVLEAISRITASRSPSKR